MRLVIKDDPNAVADWVAAYVAARINNFAPTAKKPFVLGLPTGSSPLVTYKKASGAPVDSKKRCSHNRLSSLLGSILSRAAIRCGMYPQLIEIHKAGGLSFANVVTFK